MMFIIIAKKIPKIVMRTIKTSKISITPQTKKKIVSITVDIKEILSFIYIPV